MCWKPTKGHVPRGFCGAMGKLTDVKIVVICAEPGDPHDKEDYGDLSPDEILDKVYQYAYECLTPKFDTSST